MANGPGIKQAYAMFNGQKVLATYDETTKIYAVEVNAPAESSWSQPNHVFLMTLHAEDEAGNTIEMTSDDPTYGDQLKFRVLEKTAPTATIVEPTANSVLGDSNVTAKLKVKDAGDSGLNLASAVFKVDGTATEVTGWTTDTNDEGAQIATISLTGLADGLHTFTLKVADNDGNTSTEASVSFAISTAAPSLVITAPIEQFITNVAAMTITGTAAAGSSYAPLSSVTINGETVTVGSDGAFSHEVTLTEGSNTITIVATDSLGKATTVVRNGELDTKAPVLTTLTVGGAGVTNTGPYIVPVNTAITVNAKFNEQNANGKDGTGIKNVFLFLKGQKFSYNSYDETSQFYQFSITTPSQSSYDQPDHYELLSFQVEDNAGNINTINHDSTDITDLLRKRLQLRIREKTPPVVEIIEPGANSVYGSSTVKLKVKVTDEENGSGINLSNATYAPKYKLDQEETQKLGIDGWITDPNNSNSFSKEIDLSDLTDGVHTVTAYGYDNDGNYSQSEKITFTVSTAAPSLEITTPTEGLVTNSNKVAVTGRTAAGAYTTLAGVTINGATITVNEDGTFSHEVTLIEGSNTIVIVATDSIGKATTVTRNVTLDTGAPVITDVVAEAVTVDASGKIKVTFKVTDTGGAAVTPET